MTMANEKGASISSKKIMKMLENKMKKLKLSYSDINVCIASLISDIL